MAFSFDLCFLPSTQLYRLCPVDPSYRHEILRVKALFPQFSAPSLSLPFVSSPPAPPPLSAPLSLSLYVCVTKKIISLFQNPHNPRK